MAAKAVRLVQSRQRSCLPAAIRSVLLAQGVSVSEAELSGLLGEDALGCSWEAAVLRLSGDAGLDADVRDMTGCISDDLLAFACDPEDPRAVVVTIGSFAAFEAAPSDQDHAVVLVDALHRGNEQVVTYMDPWVGDYLTATATWFWTSWELAGSRALLIQA